MDSARARRRRPDHSRRSDDRGAHAAAAQHRHLRSPRVLSAEPDGLDDLPPSVTVGGTTTGTPAAGQTLTVSVPPDFSIYQPIIISYTGNTDCVSFNGGITLKVSAPAGTNPGARTPGLCANDTSGSQCRSHDAPGCGPADTNLAAADARRLALVAALSNAADAERKSAEWIEEREKRSGEAFELLDNIGIPAQAELSTNTIVGYSAERLARRAAGRPWADPVTKKLVKKPIFYKASTYRPVEKLSGRFDEKLGRVTLPLEFSKFMLASGTVGAAGAAAVARSIQNSLAAAADRVKALSPADFAQFEVTACDRRFYVTPASTAMKSISLPFLALDDTALVQSGADEFFTDQWQYTAEPFLPSSAGKTQNELIGSRPPGLRFGGPTATRETPRTEDAKGSVSGAWNGDCSR